LDLLKLPFFISQDLFQIGKFSLEPFDTGFVPGFVHIESHCTGSEDNFKRETQG
jgi:hypothetical protein